MTLARAVFAALLLFLWGFAVPVAADVTPTAPAQEASTTVASLPRVLSALNGIDLGLSARDVARYQRIFDAQERGDWATADRLIKALGNKALLGHVQYQRYMHPTAYRSSYRELSTWLKSYRDHPGADRIHSLATKRRPKGVAGPLSPKTGRGIVGNAETYGFKPARYEAERKRSSAQRSAVKALQKRITSLVRKDMPTQALADLEQQGHALLEPAEFDRLLANIAASYYFNNRLDEALAVAKRAFRSGVHAPRSYWIAGLSAWRLKKYKTAYSAFTTLSDHKNASPWVRTAGAYWASRAALRIGRPADASMHLIKAARYPRTFYGVIASRALGIDVNFHWEHPVPTEGQLRALAKIPAGKRAMALLQVGQFALAERELRQINPRGNRAAERALVALALSTPMPSLALRIGTAVYTVGGGRYDSALYPLPAWRPDEGFTVDRAMIFALIRQESRFDPSARSWLGARGVMQLMPRTAQYVAKMANIPLNAAKLDEPVYNIGLGQRYIEYLLAQKGVDNNLFYMSIAYNAGPGNLAKWKRRLADVDDPLLFVESIPVAETREHLEKVLSSFWIYRLQLGQPTPGLTAVAAGDWPIYMALDDENVQVAEDVSH